MNLAFSPGTELHKLRHNKGISKRPEKHEGPRQGRLYNMQQFRVSVDLSRLAEGRLASLTVMPVRMHGAEGPDMPG